MAAGPFHPAVMIRSSFAARDRVDRYFIADGLIRRA